MAQEERGQAQHQLEEMRHHIQVAEQEVVQLRLKLVNLEEVQHLREKVQDVFDHVLANDLANVCL